MDDGTVLQALLGLIASLVAAGIWALKVMVTRADARAAEQGQYQAQLIRSLTKAVDHFSRFQEEEDKVHREIVQTQHDIIQTQESILTAVERMSLRDREHKEAS